MQLYVFCLVLLASSVNCYEDKPIAEYIQTSDGFIFLRNLIQQVNMTDLLTKPQDGGAITILAPTDIAFALLGQDTLNSLSNSQLRRLLYYHLVPGFVLKSAIQKPENKTTYLGEDVLLGVVNDILSVNNGAANTTASNMDIIVSNGVVQPINRVLMPPPHVNVAPNSINIIQVFLMDDTRFKDIFLSLFFANLTDILETGTYTVFAPTDAAFAKHKDSILDPTRPNAPNVFRAVSVNQANVVDANIFASNGVIHAIDDVLFPADLAQP
ncbi:Y1483-like protein [Mya arenaria]|uniref:Y1483-like protein n=1 Tax=Mya arenaria TaxID=6604 RepID=A0ABY7DQN4_MYAAR|nr:Y1483-like protein [Mya arenaria]